MLFYIQGTILIKVTSGQFAMLVAQLTSSTENRDTVRAEVNFNFVVLFKW